MAYKKRSKMSRGQSKRTFSKGNKVKSKNMAPAPMRGGIRL